MKSTKTPRKRTGQAEESDKNSRWFRVIGERFDWRPKRTVMISWKRGDIDYRPLACIEEGLRQGVIEVIGKPAHLKVHAGKVVLND